MPEIPLRLGFRADYLQGVVTEGVLQSCPRSVVFHISSLHLSKMEIVYTENIGHRMKYANDRRRN